MTKTKRIHYKKKYIHGSEKLAETTQITAKKLRKQEDLTITEVTDKDAEVFEFKHFPKRSLEFNKAGFYYQSDAMQYICTHLKQYINAQSLHYCEVKLSWNKFIDFTIGDFKDQYHKLLVELKHTRGRYCYIPKQGGGYYAMQPFILVYETVDKGKLSRSEVAKFDNIDVQKIDKVTFMMAKPLCKEYLEGGTRYFNYPTNLYARIYDMVSHIEKYIPKQEEDLKSDWHITKYIRFINYLYLHGAGDHKKHYLSVNFNDLINTVAPEFIQKDKEGRIHKEGKKIADMLTMGTIVVNQLDCLDFKIISQTSSPTEKSILVKDDPNNPNNMLFKLEHPEHNGKKKRGCNVNCTKCNVNCTKCNVNCTKCNVNCTKPL